MKITETTKYFNKTIDELVDIRNEYGFTKEECLIYDEGAEIVFFDDEKDMQEEQKEFSEYIQNKRFEIKAILKTINERIAVVLV